MDVSRIENIPAVKAFGIRMLKLHQKIYDGTDGRIGHRLLVVPALMLRTVGAKTGLPRSNALTYAKDGNDFLVVASMGGAPTAPGWYHNLKAKPEVEVQVGRKKMTALARAVFPGDADFDRLWKIVNDQNKNRYNNYQKQTTRPIPVVVLTPR